MAKYSVHPATEPLLRSLCPRTPQKWPRPARFRLPAEKINRYLCVQRWHSSVYLPWVTLKGEYQAVDYWLAGGWDGHGHEDADDGGARSSRGGLPHSTTSKATRCLTCWCLFQPVKLWGAWPVWVLLRRQNPWRWEWITEVHDHFFHHDPQVTTLIHQNQVVARLSLVFVYNSLGRRSMTLKTHWI